MTLAHAMTLVNENMKVGITAVVTSTYTLRDTAHVYHAQTLAWSQRQRRRTFVCTAAQDHELTACVLESRTW